MKKIFIVAGFDRSLLLFRGELIKSWLGRGYAVIAAAPGTGVAKDLKELGAVYRSIPLSRTGLNPLKDLILLFNLIALIRREKPVSIFLYTVKPVIYGSLACYFYGQCRVFSMITGLGYVFMGGQGSRSWLIRLVLMLYRVALRRNEKVFFQNPDDLDYFLGNDLVKPEQVVRVNGSGVDLDSYSLEPLIGGAVSFLMIARLLKEKGIREYVEAAKIVKQKYPEVVFRLVGWAFDDNPSAVGREEVEGWKREGIVEIHGETGDVRTYIREASVYVLPSYREGTPRTVLEAMAMGRAIITSDAPGCRETVEEGRNGFLVPVKDVEALARAMECFVLEPDLIEKMGRKSRRIAEKRFDVQQVNRVINHEMGIE